MNLKAILLIFCLTIIQSTYANTTKCIAHRGNKKFHLENSMEAFKSAVSVKSDGVEFDVHHTKDNIPIIMHDKTLERVAKNTNKTIKIIFVVKSIFLSEC